jgi:pimeloyl-ACP methyl ester carboxylesterase
MTCSSRRCRSYLETEQQLYTYLDEVPMILDHLDGIADRRSRSTWPAIPVVLLTATKGRPADSTEQVIVIQDHVVAAAHGRHTIVPEAGHYIHLDRPDLVIQAVRSVAAEAGRYRFGSQGDMLMPVSGD